MNAEFEVREGAWRATGWGGCRIETGAAGYNNAVFRIAASDQPSPDATQLVLRATERECACGLAPTGREIRTVVVETDEAVEIHILIEQGAAQRYSCPGNPEFSVTVGLESSHRRSISVGCVGVPANADCNGH